MRPCSITIDVQACSGCGDCVTACVDQLRRRPATAGDRTTSRIRVLGKGPLYWLALCRQCDEAPCVDACISGALHQAQAHGAVELDDRACVGCAMCVMACPFGAIWLNLSRCKSAKCDQCQAYQVPPCVAACQTGALSLDPVANLARGHRRRATKARVTSGIREAQERKEPVTAKVEGA